MLIRSEPTTIASKADRPSAGTVLVTDAGRGSAITIMRSLGRLGWRVVAADADPRAIGFQSRYMAAQTTYPDPSNAPNAFLDALYKAVEAHAVDLLIPVTDEVIHPLVAARDRFEAICTVVLPETAALDIVTHKDKTLALAQKLGVPIPITHVVHTLNEAQAVAQTMSWPIVLKPQVSRNFIPQAGVIERCAVTYANDERELAAKVQPFEGRCALLLQEYIQGSGQGVELLAYRGTPLAAFQHKRLAEIPLTGGASAWRESVSLDPELYEHAQRLVQALAWTGLIMVEFKVSEQGPRLMEINGRVWGSLPLAVFSGMDFPGQLANLYWHGPPQRIAGPGTDYPDTDYVVGVRAFNVTLIASWIPKVLLGKRRSPHLAIPARGAALAALWGLISPKQKLDTLTVDDPRPALAEIGKIVRKFTRMFARSR